MLLIQKIVRVVLSILPKPLFRQLEGPKAMLCDNWHTRNDSTNIQAILHPDLNLKNPRRPIKNIPDQPSGKTPEVYKKHCLSSNTCYCNMKPTRSTLLRRPNKCLSLEEFEHKLKEKNLSLGSLSKARSSLHCFCKGTQASAAHVDLTDKEILKKVQDELDEISDHLPITDQRRDYEEYRDEEQAKYYEAIGQYEEDIEDECDCENDVQTILGTVKSNSKYNSSRLIREGLTPEDIEQFEYTESHGDVDTTVPDYQRSQGSRYSSKKTIDNGIDAKVFIDSPTSMASMNDISMASRNGISMVSRNGTSNASRNGTSMVSGNGISMVSKNGTSMASRNGISMVSKNGTSMASRNGTLTEGSIDVQNVRKFRDENYFETHDIDEHFGKDFPEHTCVHQFRLDDRLLPQAVTIDRYGKSRCTICSKPMDGKTYTDKSYFSDKVTREKIKKFAKCIELGLVPHDISIGTSAKIELNVKTNDYIKFGKFIGSYQRPCTTNSFALRQQKMATYWKLK